MSDYTPSKCCTQCGESFPATTEYFNRAKESRDGLRHQCRKCRAQIMKGWHAANPDRSRELRKTRYQKNRDQETLYARQRYEANKDQMRGYHKEWSKNNRDKANLSARIRHARQASNISNFYQVDWQRALDYFGGCCAVCGRPPGLFHTLAMDHWVPVASPECPGTIPSNIVPLCHGEGGCNNKKQNTDASVWLNRQFGIRKGKQIMTKIQAYFDSLGGDS